jgi:hypothetical protein
MKGFKIFLLSLFAAIFIFAAVNANDVFNVISGLGDGAKFGDIIGTLAINNNFLKGTGADKTMYLLARAVEFGGYWLFILFTLAGVNVAAKRRKREV